MAAVPGAAENQLLNYLESQKSQPPPIITKASGKPIGNKDSTLTVGPNGPALLQDHHMIDEMAHFNRERIPERGVHAKGTGAFGYFEVTHDITKYCAAKIFEKVGKRTPVGVRLSTATGERGSADTVRDMRGFSAKFYTEDGNWDLVNLHIPVLNFRDPALFNQSVHAGKKNPVTNMPDPNALWDFTTLRPETIHFWMFIFSDRGIPDGYRYMDSFGQHAFKLVNRFKEAIYCKFHLKSAQGIRYLTPQRAAEIRASDPDYSTRDLFNAIGRGEFPSWNMFIQVMTFEQAERFKFNPFDITKVWPKKDYPLIPVGRLVLNKNPENFFAEIEQMALCPGNLVPGIEVSQHDKMMDCRIFAYKDTQRYRLGTNHMQLPVNCPLSKIKVANFERDGPQTYTDNQGGAPNYFPNSFGGPVESLWAKKMVPPHRISGDVCRFNDNEDNFSQPGKFWRKVLDEGGRRRLVENLVASISRTYPFIQERAVKVFSQVDREMGAMLAASLGRTNSNIPYLPPSTDWRELDYMKKQ